MADAKQEIQLALQQIKAGNKAAAVERIKSVLQADKTNVDAWFVLANALEDHAQQVKALQNALKIQPEYQRAKIMLDSLQNQPVNVGSAVPLDPRLNQAIKMVEDGFHRQGAKLATEVIKDNKTNVDAWWVLANAVDDPERRMKALQQVIRLNPHHDEAREWLAELSAEDDSEAFFDDFQLYADEDPFADFPDENPFDEDPFADGNSVEGEDPFADVPMLDGHAKPIEAHDENLPISPPDSREIETSTSSLLFEFIGFVLVGTFGIGVYYVLWQVAGDPTNVLDVAFGFLLENAP